MEEFTLDKQIHDLTIEYMKANGCFSVDKVDLICKQYDEIYIEFAEKMKNYR